MIGRLRAGLAWSLALLRRHPRRFIAAADALAALLLLLAVATEAADGFRLTILGVRISIRSTWRILAWAAIVCLVRHAVIARPPIWSRLWDRDAERQARHDTPGGTDRLRQGYGGQEVPPLLSAAAERRALDSETTTGTRESRSIARRPLVLALFVGAAVVVLFPVVSAPFSVPDHGDPLFSIWRLAWVAHQLPRDPRHLFDANIFHPHLHTLAYSDALLVPALAGAPLLWLGVHPVLVYTLLFVAAIALSGFTTFVLVRHLTGRADAAGLAGLLFAFCAFRMLHFSHLELQVTLWMPLALYWLHRTTQSGRVGDGLLTGLAVALQGLSSLYYGVFLVTFLACVTLVLWLARDARLGRVAIPLCAGAALALALLLPLTVPYLQARAEVGERKLDEVQTYSAVPGDYLVPHWRSVYHNPAVVPTNGERPQFPGVVPVVLAVAGVWPPLSPIRLAYTAGLAFAFEASLGPNGFLYPYLYRYVPLFRGFRAPARYGVLVALSLSILGGYGAARLLARLRNGIARRGVLVGLALLALLEARPIVPLEPVWKRPPAVYDALPRDRPLVLADLPFPARESFVGDDTRFMYFSTFHWHRLVNGASGFFPESYTALRETMYGFPNDASLALLRQYGVEYLAVNGKFYQGPEYLRVTLELDRRREVTRVATEMWEGSEVRLYRVEKEPR